MRIRDMARAQMMTNSLNASKKSKSKPFMTGSGRADQLTLSKEAMRVSSNGKAHNKGNTVSKVDASIDVESYFEKAREKNQKLIENCTDTEINGSGKGYQDFYQAAKEALTEKYTKLVEIAKSHDNPEGYIHDKYHNPRSPYYEAGLSDDERMVGERYETQMLLKGKINGVSGLDSLFRGMSDLGGDLTDSARMSFKRQMVDKQISNIFTKNGIKVDNENVTFSVDSYSYFISVKGASSDEMKNRMEQALNVGNNGKMLWLHINASSNIQGANSTQVSQDKLMKHRAYHMVDEYAGLDIRTLREADGTYYSGDTDVLSLTDKSVEDSPSVPEDYKNAVKDWIRETVQSVSLRGWNNVGDMNLAVGWSDGGLKDLFQSISFEKNGDYVRKCLHGNSILSFWG